MKAEGEGGATCCPAVLLSCCRPAVLLGRIPRIRPGSTKGHQDSRTQGRARQAEGVWGREETGDLRDGRDKRDERPGDMGDAREGRRRKGRDRAARRLGKRPPPRGGWRAKRDWGSTPCGTWLRQARTKARPGAARAPGVRRTEYSPRRFAPPPSRRGADWARGGRRTRREILLAARGGSPYNYAASRFPKSFPPPQFSFFHLRSFFPAFPRTPSLF